MFSTRRKDGFALLVTITLLAFLVLILVSLAAFTRVETQVASNNQQLSQARQQALMALDVALGKLQETAGPDQRATATSRITGDAGDGTRFWTGVWGNGRAADDYRSEPRLLAWLVSGNEQIDFTASIDAAEFGRITAAGAPNFTPEDAVDLGSVATRRALAADVTVRNAPARVLMGPGSLREEADYVVAPLIDVQVSAEQVPGLSGTGDVTIARYAWWIGDEGVKARLDVVDRWQDVATSNRERLYRLALAQRHGVEQMSINADGDLLFGSHYAIGDSSFRARLGKLLDMPQAVMLPGFGSAALVEGLGRRRHDLSVHSMGVIADQRRGGLRKDLSSLLANAPSSWSSALNASLDAVSHIDPDGVRRVANFEGARLHGADYSMSPGVGADARSPKAATWEQLQSFYDLGRTSTGSVAASSRSNDRMGVFPVLLWARLAFDVTHDSGGGYLHLIPQVALWNPYNAALSGEYRIRFELGSPSSDSTLSYLYLATYGSYDSDGVPEGEPDLVYHRELIAPARAGTGKYNDHTLEFRLRATAIPAGQAAIFTPEATTGYDVNGANWLGNDTRVTTSFTRSIGHTFTERQIADTSLALANLSSQPGGGIVTVHFLDDAGNPVQLMDGGGVSKSLNISSLENPQTAATSPRLSRPSSTVAGFTDATRAWSQPRDLASAAGVNYKNHIGIGFGNRMQTSGALVNWLAQYNLRTPSYGRTFFEHGGSGAANGLSHSSNWGAFGSWQTRDSVWDIEHLTTSSRLTFTGSRFTASGQPVAILFHLPRTDAPLVSLGQLQHAAMSFAKSGQEPTYAFGNSYAAPNIAQNRLLRPNTVAVASLNAGAEPHLVDTSYLLNHALWDRFFLSTASVLPEADLATAIGAGAPLPNARLRYHGMPEASDLRDFDQAAANLLVSGAFNVNSTSVEAWAALLSALRGVGVAPSTGGTSTISVSPFVRTLFVPGGFTSTSSANRWSGYRGLSDGEIRTLAGLVVDEVRARGPFLSLADFVNRRLVAHPDASGLRGVLQAGIDAMPSINKTILDVDRPGTSDMPADGNETWTYNGQAYYHQAIQAPRKGSADPSRSKAGMAPGFLTQADILSSLGPVLSARSDTFVIRTYGEIVHPVEPDVIAGRAWCEAVVQRLPDYVDSGGNPAHVAPVSGTVVNLTAENQSLGRRFSIVSFRWLSPEEI